MLRESSCKITAVLKALEQEAESLDNCAVVQPSRVLEESILVEPGRPEVVLEALSDMLYAAARAGVGEHVYDRFVGIGHEYLGSPVPDYLRAEERFFRDVPHDELYALKEIVPAADLSSGKDAETSEYLLGEVPVFRCAPPADIAWRKELRHQQPGVVENLFVVDGRYRDRGVHAAPDAPDVALLIPASKEFGRLGSPDIQSTYDIIDMDEIRGAPDNSGETLSPPRDVRTGRYSIVQV